MNRLLIALLLCSCGDDSGVDSGPFDPECGDLDGDGTNTGDLPDVLELLDSHLRQVVLR